MARFARVRTDRDGPIGDIEAGAAFVRADMSRAEDAAAPPAPAPPAAEAAE